MRLHDVNRDGTSSGFEAYNTRNGADSKRSHKPIEDRPEDEFVPRDDEDEEMQKDDDDEGIIDAEFEVKE